MCLFQITVTENEMFKTYMSYRRVEADRQLNKLGTIPDRDEYVLHKFCKFRNYCDVFINANNVTGSSSQK